MYFLSILYICVVCDKKDFKLSKKKLHVLKSVKGIYNV